MFDPFGDSDWSLNIPRLRVSLRIRGDGLDPDFLTQLLGVGPTESGRRGDVVERRGRETERRTGFWTYRLDVPEDTELGSVIEMLLAVFPDDTTMWEEIVGAYAVDVCCGVFLEADDQSTTLDADVLAALGRRGLGLSFDLHAPSSAAAGEGRDEDDDA